MDPDGGRESLQRKVQFDVRFYFCWQGFENMETMKRSMFQVKVDYRSGCEYICKVEDESTKNHKESDIDIQTAIMPENRDDRHCPVRSFKMYLSYFHPDNPFLWQTPNLQNYDSNIWYTRGHLGKNSLGPFMKDVSRECGLSKSYTNHCIHVTGITVLTMSNFSSKEIMAVSGHKSVQSLTTYQWVKDPQKLEMGKMLNTSLKNLDSDMPVCGQNRIPIATASALRAIEAQVKITEPLPSPSLPQQTSTKGDQTASKTQLVAYEPNFDDEIPDIYLLSYIAELQNEELNAPKTQVQSKFSAITNTMTQRNSPMFAGCKIGNINIIINKNWRHLLTGLLSNFSTQLDRQIMTLNYIYDSLCLQITC